MTVACVSGRRTVEVLAGLGLRTVLIDDEISAELAWLADVAVEADLDDWDAVERALSEVHRRSPLSAVLSTRDSYVRLAAFLAARLGVRGLALPAALNCRDKARFRRVLQSAGLPAPRWAQPSRVEEAVSAAGRLGYPVVVKPREGAGAAGVRYCRGADEVSSAAGELTAGGKQVLVEEYVEGPELAVQAVTVDRRTEVVNVLLQHVGPPPRFAELGYDFPSGLTAREEQAARDLAEATLSALGFDNGASHIQLRMGPAGPVVIEVNPRPPGGRLSYLTEVVSGLDLVRAAIEATLGGPVTRTAPVASCALYRCVTFSESGVVSYRPEVEQNELPPLEGPLPPLVEMDVSPGDLVLPLDDPEGGVYGRVLVFGNDRAQTERDHQAILEALQLRVDPIPARLAATAAAQGR
ncbi:MAG: ATP-grasp domain-containing protein [Chloroflexi bacterium]|nr:MAG: ATP-grasp domain-containing protein [Chloroflexota bacterium]